MNKQAVILISVLLLSGCDAIQAPIAENSLQSAIESGNIEEQLSAIDKLSVVAPNKYQHLADKKEHLLPFLYQLMENPSDLSGIKDTVLSDIIEFSPNYSALSYAKQYLNKKKGLNKILKEAQAVVVEYKTLLSDKLKATPSHVQTYQTTMMLNTLAPYLLLSDFTKELQRSRGEKQLTGYQIDALSAQLTNIYQANEKIISAVNALNVVSQHDDLKQAEQQLQENQDIMQIMLWLYKKQLLVSYHDLLTQNEYLLSLLKNQYGVQSMDNVWLTIVEPEAKKLVVERKQTQLSVLNKLASTLDKLSADYPRLDGLYAEHGKLEELMLSLLWPQDGLVNFEPSSIKNTKLLWLEVNKKQQL